MVAIAEICNSILDLSTAFSIQEIALESLASLAFFQQRKLCAVLERAEFMQDKAAVITEFFGSQKLYDEFQTAKARWLANPPPTPLGEFNSVVDKIAQLQFGKYAAAPTEPDQLVFSYTQEQLQAAIAQGVSAELSKGKSVAIRPPSPTSPAVAGPSNHPDALVLPAPSQELSGGDVPMEE